MRIFLAIPSSPNPTFASSLWKANLHDPLVEMGHDVVLWDEGIQALFDLDPGASATAPVRTLFSERFLAEVVAADRARSLDLVITYVSDSHLEPAAIDTVREQVAPIANFFCNNIHQFHLVRRTARHFTVCLVPEWEALARYRKAGAEPIFFPMAANPEVYRPLDLPVAYGVTFAGQRYADRATLMLALCEGGLDAHAFGQGWAVPASPGAATTRSDQGPAALGRLVSATLRGRNPFRAIADRRDWEALRTRHSSALHGPVSDQEYVALFSKSAVNLGFLVLGDTHRTRHPLRQVRLREFEAPMSGAFYLTEWLEELERHYVIGHEIECYRSRAELVDKCRYYLANDDARERIRRAGLERARRDHTWRRRFDDLFLELGTRGVLK